MKETRRNVLVGLFVLVGLGAMGFLIVLFGQGYSFGMRANTNSITIRFEYAGGIKPDTLVTVGGIEIGRVAAVGFVNPQRFDQGVNVRVRLNPDIRIPQGSTARTSEPGFGTGRPPIEILPGPAGSAVLASGEIIPGRMSKMVESLIPPAMVSTFDRTATQLGEAAAALTPVLNDMHELMQQRTPAAVDTPGGPPGNLASSMARLDAALKNVNTVLGDPQVDSKLRATVENLHAISEDGRAMASDLKGAAADAKAVTTGAKEMITTVNAAVQKTDQRIDDVTSALRRDLELASEFLTQLNTIANKANRGEGTIGKLVGDDRLYEAMTISFRRLGETLDEFKLLIKDWQQGKIKVAL